MILWKVEDIVNAERRGANPLSRFPDLVTKGGVFLGKMILLSGPNPESESKEYPLDGES